MDGAEERDQSSFEYAQGIRAQVPRPSRRDVIWLPTKMGTTGKTELVTASEPDAKETSRAWLLVSVRGLRNKTRPLGTARPSSLASVAAGLCLLALGRAARAHEKHM